MNIGKQLTNIERPYESTSKGRTAPRTTQRLVLLALLGTIAFTLTVPNSGLAAATLPNLGTAGSFGVLAGSAVTNTGPTTVDGNVGVSPGTAVTGFPPGITSGLIYPGDAVALQAHNDASSAYGNAAGQVCDFNLTGQDLGGMILVPGVYCFNSSAQLTGRLTLDGQGNPGSVFIFKLGSTLTTASNAIVSVINGTQSCSVFWQVGSSATLGTNTHFEGNILALTSITLNTGTTTGTGLYALNGAVTLDTNTIQACSFVQVPTNTPTRAATGTAVATGVPATNTPRRTSVPRATPVPTETPGIVNTDTPVTASTPTPANTAVPTDTPAVPTGTAVPPATATATGTIIETATSTSITSTPTPAIALDTPTIITIVTGTSTPVPTATVPQATPIITQVTVSPSPFMPRTGGSSDPWAGLSALLAGAVLLLGGLSIRWIYRRVEIRANK